MVLQSNCRQHLNLSPKWGVKRMVRSGFHRFRQFLSTLLLVLRSFGRIVAAIPLTLALTLIAPLQACWAQGPNADQAATGNLKQLSLEQLGNLEVTSVSKEPERMQRAAAAIYVLTQEDIRRSGATSIPEVLRLVPVLKLHKSTPALGPSAYADSETVSLNRSSL